MPASGISPHGRRGKFRWTAGKEKGVGFRLYNHSPSSSFSRYEDRERRRGNRAGGCRRKRNALASRCAHQGIIVRGSVLVSAAVRAWLVRERTRCRGWQRREGREVLPLWWNATGTRADVAQSRECKKRGHSRGARLSFRCPVPDSFSLGCHGSISSPHTNPQSPHFLALPDPVATAPVFDPADERGVRHRHREDRREQLPPSPTATAPVADSTLFRNRSLK